MVTKLKDFKLVRGDSLNFGFRVLELSEPIEGVTFSCKKSTQDTEYVFQKTLGDGIEYSTDEEGARYDVHIAPEDTAELPVRRYSYDLEVEIGSDIFTLLLGRIDLVADVTRR